MVKLKDNLECIISIELLHILKFFDINGFAILSRKSWVLKINPRSRIYSFSIANGFSSLGVDFVESTIQDA